MNRRHALAAFLALPAASLVTLAPPVVKPRIFNATTGKYYATGIALLAAHGWRLNGQRILVDRMHEGPIFTFPADVPYGMSITNCVFECEKSAPLVVPQGTTWLAA